MLRGTIIQNHAAAMANMKELSAGFKQFWEQQPGGDDPMERFKEFGVSSFTLGANSANAHARWWPSVCLVTKAEVAGA